MHWSERSGIERSDRVIANGLLSMMMMRAWIGALALGCGTASCAVLVGIDDYDVIHDGDAAATVNDDGGSPNANEGGALTDGLVGATDGPPPCDPAKDPSCIVLPPGFELVAITDNPPVDADAGTADSGPAAPPDCPTGFGNPADHGQKPTPKADACTCNCNITKNATCTTGHVEDQIGGTTCTTSSVTLDIAGCKAFNGTLIEYSKLTPKGDPDGQCSPTGAPISHPERVSWETSARVCASITRCGSGYCDGSQVNAPYQACIATNDSSATCPPAFPSKRVLGATASFTCGACSGACTVSFNCAGTLEGFANQGCTTLVGTLAVDGVCHQAVAVPIKSYRFNLTSQNNACSVQNPAATNPIITASRTFCCR